MTRFQLDPAGERIARAELLDRNLPVADGSRGLRYILPAC
jgi:hypothetical protein